MKNNLFVHSNLKKFHFFWFALVSSERTIKERVAGKIQWKSNRQNLFRKKKNYLKLTKKKSIFICVQNKARKEIS